MTRLLLLLIVACASPQRTTSTTTWARDLPNGEAQYLHLFDSGIMGFQHVGPKLPISRAYGRWSERDGKLAFDVVGVEPDGATMPAIDLSQWTASDVPTSERDWTYLVNRR